MLKELKENKRLNRLEVLSLAKSYLPIYSTTNDKEYRKELLTNLKKYLSVVRKENTYLTYLINNFDKIRDFEGLDTILNNIDIINEDNYKYFDALEAKHINNVLSDDSLEKEIIGLTLSKEDLVNYYHKNDAIYYLLEHSKVLDTNLEDTSFYGCFPIIKEDKLEEIKVCVPPINNLKSMLINIHEYKHGIDLYPYLGKSYIEQDYEVLARNEEINFQKTLSLKKGKVK